MKEPPIPSELNPKNHQERPGEPPANHPPDPEAEAEQDLEALYEQEEEERARELLEQRREPLNNPNTPK